MRALVRGLYEGPADGSLGTTRGAAQVAIQFTHQNIPFVSEYKEDWKAWLKDDAYWADMGRYVRWLGKEVYADSRYWGPPESSLRKRARHLQQYLFHVVELSEAAPRKKARTARNYLRDAFLPLANATWAALGPDRFTPLFCCGHGETMMPIDQMLHYVTEEMYAIRKYARRHRDIAPAGRLGFTWQPTNNFMVSQRRVPRGTGRDPGPDRERARARLDAQPQLGGRRVRPARKRRELVRRRPGRLDVHQGLEGLPPLEVADSRPGSRRNRRPTEGGGSVTLSLPS